MNKCVRIFAIFLSLIFLFTGCNDEFTIDETKTAGIYYRRYSDIEKIKSVEEDKNLLKEKEEYMKLFEEFCGFPLPDYFTFPKVTEEHNWNRVNIDERFFSIGIHFIMEKNDALEMLDYLRSQDYLSKDTCWTAYTYLFAGITNTPKGIAKARCFKKETKKGDFTLNFHYNKDNDVFIVYILSALERDPPPGTSWPELYFN